MEENCDYRQDQQDEHGWVNPAIQLCLYVALIGTIGIAGIITIMFV